jgi:hypothetical protein
VTAKCGAAHREGCHPAAAYVWVYDNGAKLLLCQRHLRDCLADLIRDTGPHPAGIAMVSQ